MHTLRIDSAYATAAGDSVYTFNRLMRYLSPVNARYLKSRNNLLGARLRWQPGTKNYYLEANAEPALGGPTTPTVLLLKPQAAVGSTWAASTTPALSATLSGRSLGTVGSAPDSIATITLSNGQLITFSRSYGLVMGPQWLTLGSSPLPASWQQLVKPQVGLGSNDPRTLLTLDAGDEIGYKVDALAMFSPSCYTGYRLRRITARSQTLDSLIISYKEQDIITTSSWPGCGTPGTALRAVVTGRWAFSLFTGNSPQFPFLGLLTGEYRPIPNGLMPPYAFYLAQTASWQQATTCLASTQALPTLVVYGSAATPGTPAVYAGGLDAAYGAYTFSASLGVGLTYLQRGEVTNQLIYYRHNNLTCGSSTNFSTLLPSRAAQAAAAATLHPNPATEAATLTLAAPTLPGSTLALTDALGRRVWSTELAAGQTAILVPLAGQANGLYLVQLLAPGTAPLTWKVAKQ